MSEGSGGKVAVAAGGGILALFAALADDCGRVAVRSGDDLARIGAHSGDDIARLGTHGDDLARLGTHGDDLARGGVIAAETGAQGERAVEQVVRATPRELGFQPAVARRAARFQSTVPGPLPSRYAWGRKARFVALAPATPTSASSFAEDLSRAVLEVGLDAPTIADLVDAFLGTQELAEAAEAGGTRDAADTAAEMTREIEALLDTLPPPVRHAVERQLGPPEIIAYRLAEGRPLRRTGD